MMIPRSDDNEERSKIQNKDILLNESIYQTRHLLYFCRIFSTSSHYVYIGNVDGRRFYTGVK